jgi:hypothetical protein
MSKQFKNTVETAVNSALEGTGYAGYGVVNTATEKIAEAVSEQVARAADTLRSVGQEQGLPESDVENALIAAGLVDEPEPEVEEEEIDPTSTEAVLARLGKVEDTLAEVLTIARRYGYQG